MAAGFEGAGLPARTAKWWRGQRSRAYERRSASSSRMVSPGIASETDWEREVMQSPIGRERRTLAGKYHTAALLEKALPEHVVSANLEGLHVVGAEK